MKKFIYIVLISVVTAMSLSGCTEQEVKPRDGGPAGSGSDPKN